MADADSLEGIWAHTVARRDPSCLEVLGSSSSDDNKTLLTSSLYMGTKGGAGLLLTSTASTRQLQLSQLSPERGKGGRAGHLPARKSTELRFTTTRRSAAARPGGGILRRHTLYEPSTYPICVYAYCVDTPHTHS